MRLSLLPLSLAACIAATPLVASAQTYYRHAAQTVRFPGYDERLGSLLGYRSALIEAVDRHIAAIEAGYLGAWQVQPVDVVAPRASAGPNSPSVGRIGPSVVGAGAIGHGIGVDPGPIPSGNRQLR